MRRNISKLWSLIKVLRLCQKLLISHFPVLFAVAFFFISAGVISEDSFESDAITFTLNKASVFSNITLRIFNATEPDYGLCKQGKILIRSYQELTLETSPS